MSVTASITLDGIAAMSPEDVRAAGRTALRAIGRHWINTMLPLHFTTAAFARYGYAWRKQNYRFKKRTRVAINGVEPIGEDKPLVWSGRSRNRAKAARIELKNDTGPNVVAEAVIDAPALNFIPQGGHINMRDEVTRVNQQEIDELGKLFVEEFERQLVKRGKAIRRLKIAA